MKKCVVIYNPNSGKKNKKDFTNKFLDILKKYNYDAEIIPSKHRGHIIEIVKDLPEDIDLVVSLGGDGTFNESMRGNFRREKRLVLSHIPMGTTNDIGKMFGYKKNIFTNLKLLLEGETKNIDICTLNGEPFVYVSGFGKFMSIPYETSSKSKKNLGYIAYLISGLKDIFRFTKLKELTYEIDGVKYQGLYSFAFVANATRIAGVKNVFYDVKLDDNSFEVLFCNLSKKKDIIKTLYYLGKTDITHVPGFYFHKTDNLKINFEKEKDINWCIDGEKIETKNSLVEIKIDKNVQIRIPKTKIKELFVGENKKSK